MLVLILYDLKMWLTLLVSTELFVLTCNLGLTRSLFAGLHSDSLQMIFCNICEFYNHETRLALVQ